MAPKLNKLAPVKQSPPKGSTMQPEGSVQQSLAPLSSTAPGPDPFAPKKNVLGAISPQKDDIVSDSQKDLSDTGDIQETKTSSNENNDVEEEARLEKEKMEAEALVEAEKILAEEIRQEEAELDASLEKGTDAFTGEEEKDGNTDVDTQDKMEDMIEKFSREEDEVLEETNPAAQETKIDHFLNKRENHLAAYQKSISSLSLDVPFLRAVYKDDITTIKRFLKEDFPEIGSENAVGNFLDVRDSEGRTALHVVAGGDSPMMVEYLLTHNRICVEKTKFTEMKNLKQNRKKCLTELQLSMKKSENLSGTVTNEFSKHDYRVEAIEKWFEREVARIHRKVELLVEGQWLSGMLRRDRLGLTPLHYAVRSGSLSVLSSLLCLPPFFSGRGVFSELHKRSELQKATATSVKKRGGETEPSEKPYEWFDAKGVYNSVTGEEVAVVHKLGKSDTHDSAKMVGNSDISGKLTLPDITLASSIPAQLSPFAHEERATEHLKLDYDIVVPWLVRNVHSRSNDMGKKLGASAVEVLEEMVEMICSDKNRVLILPEIRELLRYLGIVVTTDVIKELCNIYPASLDLVEEKYQAYRDDEDDMLLSDSKSFSSKFPMGAKRSEKKGSRDLESKSLGESKDGSVHKKSLSKSSKESKNEVPDKDNADDIDDNTWKKRKSIFNPGGEEEAYGLSLDLFFDDIATGQGMKSIFSDTNLLTEVPPSVKPRNGRTENLIGSENDKNDQFHMPQVVSVPILMQYRKLLLNCRDGAGNSPLLVAAALGKLKHLELLISCGADISVETVDHQTPLSVAKNASIIGILQRELVSQISSKKRHMLSGKRCSQSSSSELNASIELVDSFKLNTGQTNPRGTQSGRSEDMILQLHDLKAKRWAYSQSALSWAVESGDIEAVDNMISMGIDINEADISGRNPLHVCVNLASQAGDSQSLVLLRKIIESLLNSGANVSATTVSGKTPLHELFTKNKNLKESKMSPGDLSVLHHFQALLVRSLLHWGADPLKTDRQGYSSLYYCAKENMSVCMAEILRSRTVNVYCQDPRGRTILHTACIHGSEDVATIISNYDADFAVGIQTIEDKDGKTAKYLMSPHMSGSCLMTMWQACRLGNAARVNAILVKFRKSDSVAVYENVEEEQAPRNPLDVTSGHEDTNQDLWLLGGVDCKTRLHKWTPLHACIIGWGEFNAIKNKDKSTIRALQHGEKNASNSALKKKFGYRNKSRSFPTSLSTASFSTVLSILIQNFAFVDSLEFKCRTPLMLASALNLSAAVSLLCTAGADVNMKDLDGNTALHYAYACGSSHAVSTLEEKDADTNAENMDGKTPFEVVGLVAAVAPIFK